jgi:hypothetical protein
MRWDQKTITTYVLGKKTTYIKTFEKVYPFRSFKQSINKEYWILPKGVDKLVETMEKARLEKNWEVADQIRHSLLRGGIIVRNGKDWYPKQIELEVKAERDFTAWLYSTSVSAGKSKEKSKKIKDHFDGLIKEQYDI